MYVIFLSSVRFYRYVLSPSLQFDEDGQLATGPQAVFRDIPETPLLTMNLDIPQAWMVEAVKSPYDLDNIYLKEVSIVQETLICDFTYGSIVNFSTVKIQHPATTFMSGVGNLGK